jgi:hypothetical protein
MRFRKYNTGLIRFARSHQERRRDARFVRSTTVVSFHRSPGAATLLAGWKPEIWGDE